MKYLINSFKYLDNIFSRVCYWICGIGTTKYDAKDNIITNNRDIE